MLLQDVFNGWLDRLVHTQIHIGDRSWSAFRLFGYLGLALAILLTMTLVAFRGLSSWAMTGVVLTAVLTFFGLAVVTKVVTGRESLTYYHHQIAVIVMATLFLWLARQPVMAYLDVTILGVGVFLACGRVGCLMVGCCHGRPYRWGVCYRVEHADVGFMPYLVGVRLFPIQAIESMWVFCIVLVGSVFILSGRPPGEALAWYIVTYGLGRFFFEFMRGDPERSYYGGFSEPQWTSLILMVLVVGAEMSGVLLLQSWHLGAVVFLMGAMVLVSVNWRLQKTMRYRLLHPKHVREVAEAIGWVANSTAEQITVTRQVSVSEDIEVKATSLGIQISGSKIESASGYINHYALSCQNEIMAEGDATTLAELILQLKHPVSSSEMMKGNQGVYHLLVQS